jgi:adenine-specific DNA-methyltransferase
MDHPTDFLTYCLQRGERILSSRSEESRKEKGQFLTPPAAARFMARQLGQGSRFLDPALGSAILACAIIELAIETGQTKELWIDGYEIDDELYQTACESLAWASQRAAEKGIVVHVNVKQADFVMEGIRIIAPLFGQNSLEEFQPYDGIISNPPYFKLNTDDSRVKAVSGHVKGSTNIYTLFMAISARLLAPNGKACYIVPRSFCSGAYFAGFRRDFLARVTPVSIHLFESREDTFKKDSVLQENVIVTYRPKKEYEKTENEIIQVSASKNADDMNGSFAQIVQMKHFVGKHNGELFFRIPLGELDEQIIETVDQWPGTLEKYGLEVSTGPVVSFRSKQFLTDENAVEKRQAVPLLWMNNIKPGRVVWPIPEISKQQGILSGPESAELLVKNQNYVLLRRFSAKEEPRRLIAAPLLESQFIYDRIGLENHLNFVYRKKGMLEQDETAGLAALYNSALIDRYFRISNGNTQVNAAELRALPLPPLEIIKAIGQELIKAESPENDIDQIVFSVLRNNGYITPDFPTIKETRIKMGKIQEAQELLKVLGLPEKQQNEISALTLLALASLQEYTAWKDAIPAGLRTHDLRLWIKENYNREYAENTRETFRRQVLHQFLQAGIVHINAHNPKLSTNSPNTRYSLSEPALEVIRAFGSDAEEKILRQFRETHGALIELYRGEREKHRIPLQLPDGEEYFLSPGKHNELEVSVIKEFRDHFAKGSTVLYLGDTANKTLHIKEVELAKLSIPVSSHDKLPDIVLFNEGSNRLFLIEVVTSHGPVSPKRLMELEGMLKNCPAKRIYVSAFPDFFTFKKYAADIAWETEVWLQEWPDHMIHFNGDKFLKSLD